MNLKNSKEAILNHALAIFGRLGFNKTTMADIATESKRGRRTIYTYFKTKEEIYAAVIERETMRVISGLEQGLKTIILPDQKFSFYLNNRLLAIVDLANRHDAVKKAFKNNYFWVERILKQFDIKDKALLVSILDEGCNANVFFINDKQKTIDTIQNIIKGFEFIIIRGANQATINSQIQNLNQILLNGLLTR